MRRMRVFGFVEKGGNLTTETGEFVCEAVEHLDEKRSNLVGTI